MIPSSNEELEDEMDRDFEIETDPSLTYAMILHDEETKDNSFVGKTDDEAALKQAILKILNTNRYEHEIYSSDYGIEIQDLFGQSMIYCMSEVKTRITEALLADDRIESVDDFTVEILDKRSLHVKFTVTPIQGDEIEIEKEVSV